MNPLTNVKNITKLNETELASGSIHKKSWHDMYKESAWIFIGGLQYDLTEGDILAVFSQYGEIVNINLVRDKKSGHSKGFCFLCYSNQKSTVLAVDNFNGIKICNRTIRVDHVANYKPPKEDERDDEITKKLKSEGCAPKFLQAAKESDAQLKLKKKKAKKEKKEKKKKKKDKKDDTERETPTVEIKQEKHDPGYEKYDCSLNQLQHATKIRHREKSLEKSKGEASQTYDKYRSKDDMQYNRTSNKSNKQYVDDYTDEDRLLNKVKHKKESEPRKESFKENNKHISSSKSHKRKRSSSSDGDTFKKHTDTVRHKGEANQAKSRYSDSSNRKHKNTDHSSSSSSDDDCSSTQSSSSDERDKNKSKYTRENKSTTYSEKRSYEKDSKYKLYDRGGDSNYTSNKSKDYDKAKKYSEHSKSSSKYQSDDSDDTDHKNYRRHRRDKK